MWNGSTAFVDDASTNDRRVGLRGCGRLQGLADRYDPHRLPNPDISERHEDYLMYRLASTRRSACVSTPAVTCLFVSTMVIVILA